MSNDGMRRRGGGGKTRVHAAELWSPSAILTIVSGTVMRGILEWVGIEPTVSNRTDMHSGVRNATELPTQRSVRAAAASRCRAGDATAASAMGATTLTVTSTAEDVAVTTRMSRRPDCCSGTGAHQEP